MKTITMQQLSKIVSTLLVEPEVAGELDEHETYTGFVREIAEVVANYCGGSVRQLVPRMKERQNKAVVEVCVQVEANDSLPDVEDNIWTCKPAHAADVVAAADDAADEAAITEYLQQQIEDGNLSPEDLAARMARYGLMDPVDFAAEMQERIEMQADELDASRSATRMSI